MPMIGLSVQTGLVDESSREARLVDISRNQNATVFILEWAGLMHQNQQPVGEGHCHRI